MMNLPLVLLSLSVASGADYPNQLAAVPPMGWNSWNCYGGQIDADGILAQAEAMVSSGLRDHGFLYLVIDDGWQGERSGPIDALQGDDGFPDMGELANQVRALGLRPGIYSTPWETSYQGREGSADYEVQDAWQFADWGYAYLKYDWHPVDVAAATRMRDALASAPRPLVYSLSNSLEMELAPTWASVANLWRTTFDITDNWDSMSGIGFGQDGLERYAGPGSWNDPDMMVLGYVGWGAEQHPTGLTADEQRTHVSLWALLAAPLMLGCDMTRLDEDTLALLTNDEVLAVDQDPAGIQGSRLAAGEGWEVWRKPLASGADAVGLFNRGEVDLAVQVSWEWLERGGVQPVRDLWDQADLGGYEEGFSATLPPHGARLLRVGEADPIPPALLEPLAETAVLGEPFGYTFLTSGTRPLDIQAEGLPAGLTLEGATLSGSPEETGSFQVVVGVSNEAGSTEGTLMLEVSEPVQDDDPRILLFSASELSLPPGQPGVLSWVAQGVDEVTLEPDLGSQPAEGSVTIAPLQTTTYTLSMEGGQSYALQVEVPQGSVLAGLSCPGRLRPTNPEDEWQGWGEAHEDTSSDGDPLSVGGTEALNGIGTHADSTLEYTLGGYYQRFSAQVGLDDEVQDVRGGAEFSLWLDDDEQPAWSSGVMGVADPALEVSLDLSGVQRLRLVVDGGESIDYDHADWLDARLWLAGALAGDTAEDTGGSAGGADSGQSGAPCEEDCPQGCGCAASPRRGVGLWGALGLLGLAWRRRGGGDAPRQSSA